MNFRTPQAASHLMVLITVPKDAVPVPLTADDAVTPLLDERFGWAGYIVLDPREDEAAYVEATRLMNVNNRLSSYKLIDAQAGLVRITAGIPAFAGVDAIEFPQDGILRAHYDALHDVDDDEASNRIGDDVIDDDNSSVRAHADGSDSVFDDAANSILDTILDDVELAVDVDHPMNLARAHTADESDDVFIRVVRVLPRGMGGTFVGEA